SAVVGDRHDAGQGSPGFGDHPLERAQHDRQPGPASEGDDPQRAPGGTPRAGGTGSTRSGGAHGGTPFEVDDAEYRGRAPRRSTRPIRGSLVVRSADLKGDLRAGDVAVEVVG